MDAKPSTIKLSEALPQPQMPVGLPAFPTEGPSPFHEALNQAVSAERSAPREKANERVGVPGATESPTPERISAERPEKDRSEKSEKTDRSDKQEAQRAERNERSDRADRTEKTDKADKAEKAEKTERETLRDKKTASEEVVVEKPQIKLSAHAALTAALEVKAQPTLAAVPSKKTGEIPFAETPHPRTTGRETPGNTEILISKFFKGDERNRRPETISSNEKPALQRTPERETRVGEREALVNVALDDKKWSVSRQSDMDFNARPRLMDAAETQARIQPKQQKQAGSERGEEQSERRSAPLTAGLAEAFRREERIVRADTPKESFLRDNRDLFNDLVEKARMNFGADGKSSASIRLRPEHLGNITLNLRMDKNQLEASVVVENKTAARLMQDELEHLRTELKFHGIQVDQLAVRIREESQMETANRDARQENMGNFGNTSSDFQNSSDSTDRESPEVPYFSDLTEVSMSYEMAALSSKEGLVDISV